MRVTTPAGYVIENFDEICMACSGCGAMVFCNNRTPEVLPEDEKPEVNPDSDVDSKWEDE